MTRDEATRQRKAEAMRRYRAKNGKRDYLAARARGRAMERLAQLHHDEYEALVLEERAARGLPNAGDIVRKEAS